MNTKVKVILALLWANTAVKALAVHVAANVFRADTGCPIWWHVSKSWGGYVGEHDGEGSEGCSGPHNSKCSRPYCDVWKLYKCYIDMCSIYIVPVFI